MKLGHYGTWTPEGFHQALRGLSWYGDTDEANVEMFREDLVKRGFFDSFVEAYTAFLLDESASWSEKGDLYLLGMSTARDAWDNFKWIWDLLKTGKPWPLEGQARPEGDPDDEESDPE